MAATARMQREMTQKAQHDADCMENDAEHLLEKFRLTCLSRGCNGINSFGRLFRILDDDGSNCLCFKEFQKAVRSQAPDLSTKNCKLLFDEFDNDGDQRVNYDEFILALRPPMSKSRTKLIKQAFQKLDKDGSGVVTVEDLHGVYDASHHKKFKSGEYTEDDVFREFLTTFDTPNEADGRVEWEEFLNYYAGVSACVDSDAYFDLMMRQAWKL